MAPKKPALATDQQSLITQAERVQALLLREFEQILEDGTAAPTDRATIARYLMANNFRVDANSLPKALSALVAETRAARGNKPRVMPAADDVL